MSNPPYTLSDHPLHQAIYDLCQQIEKCGASPELTKAVTMASELQAGVLALRKQLQAEDRAHTDTMEERDKAEDAADELTSAVLGEPIDWSNHDAKWQEATEEAGGLRADAARLDWLDENMSHTGGGNGGTYSFTTPADVEGGMLRAAIDAAMAAKN